jgi:shikimate 5-dehydrogenase
VVEIINNLKELIEKGMAQIAKLPPKNDIELSQLDSLAAYTVPIIAHDYSAKTPLMWNSVYEKLGLNLRNIMIVADSQNMIQVLETLRRDPKYLGGGAGVGLKEKVIPYLDRIEPQDLKAVNIIVKENGKLVGYNTDSQGLYKSIEDALMKEDKKIANSRFLILGAGGVAKEFASLLAKNDAERIVIINRTYGKAVSLAYSLNQKYNREVAYGAPEDMTRGLTLNTLKPLDAIINVSDKGSDGPLEKMSAFAPVGEYNNTISIEILRLLKHWNPNIVIADIVIPKSGRTTTLNHADSACFKNIVDGNPMVINQAAPAYKLVEAANKNLHNKTLSEQEIWKIMHDTISDYKK